MRLRTMTEHQEWLCGRGFPRLLAAEFCTVKCVYSTRFEHNTVGKPKNDWTTLKRHGDSCRTEEWNVAYRM